MNILEKGIRCIARKCVYGPKASSKSYIRYLRSIGVQVGEGTVFFNPMTVTIAEGEPFMLTIGKNCQITGGGINHNSRLWMGSYKGCLWGCAWIRKAG